MQELTVPARADHKLVLVATVIDKHAMIELAHTSEVNRKGQMSARLQEDASSSQ